MKKTKLDKYEKEVLKSFDQGEWISINNVEEEKKSLSEYAKTASNRNKRICVNLSEHDFIGLQQKAVHEGMIWQSFIESILHKFANGKLAEKNIRQS
jgi:predicted DNA binding CopG/RHH family protein